MKEWRTLYRFLAILTLFFGLWGFGRLALAINQPMGGFIWYYDEAVSGGWIVNWDTGLEWPAIGENKLHLGDRILAIDDRPPDEFGHVYRTTPLGTGVKYEVLRDGKKVTVPDVPVVAFTWSMFFQSQVVLFLVGSLYWGMGVFIHRVTLESDYGYAFSFFALSTSLLTLSHAPTVCVTTPFRPQGLMFFFWKPIFGAAIVSSLYFATAFPASAPGLPSPLSKHMIRSVAWVTGGSLFVLYSFTGLLPYPLQQWDAWAYKANLVGFVLSLLGCAAIFAYIARTSESFIARQQAIVMLVGWGLAALPILLMWIKLVFPGFYVPSWNVIAFLELALPLSIVYAILHYRLFRVHLYVLRILYHGLLLVGFLFIYVTVSLLLQSFPSFNRMQTALTRLTYQRFDLRATLGTLVAMLVVFRLYIPLQQWTRFQSGLKPRFPAILAHLCDRLNAQNAYIALRQKQVFVVEATHNMPLPRQSLSLYTVLGDETGIVLKAPLEEENNEMPLGVIALGPKRDGLPYTPTEEAFVMGTVVELITVSLLNLQQLMQLEDAAQASKERITQVQDNAQVLQSELTHTLTMQPEEMIEAVEQALYALSYDWPADLEALAESPLAALPIASAKLSDHDTADTETWEYVKAEALKTILLETIDTLKPPFPKDLNDDDWLYYLILKGAFVEDKHWKQLHIDLLLSQAGYYRKRRGAIAKLAHQIESRSQSVQ